MHILKKGIVLIPVITTVLMAQITFAKESSLELKKACLKDNPLAVGDTDSELITLYAQVCDKKNAKNSDVLNHLNIQIAQKYRILGNNLKALQLVDQLNKNNINTQELTDINFLAGVAISQNALNQMRTVELRSLTETAYAPAKKLTDTIRFAQPTVDIYSAKKSDSFSKSNKSTAKSNSVKKTKSSSATKTSIQKNTKTNPSKENVTVKATITSSNSPFDAFNKK